MTKDEITKYKLGDHVDVTVRCRLGDFAIHGSRDPLEFGLDTVYVPRNAIVSIKLVPKPLWKGWEWNDDGGADRWAANRVRVATVHKDLGVTVVFDDAIFAPGELPAVIDAVRKGSHE